MNSSNSVLPMTPAKAIRMSWSALFTPGIFFRLLIPVFLAIGFCVVLLAWGSVAIQNDFVPYLKVTPYFQSVINFIGDTVASFFILLSFVILTLFASYFLTIILVSIILVPLITPAIQKKYFPSLQAKAELSQIGSIRNSLQAILVFAGCFIIGLPLLAIPGGQIVIFYLLNSYLAKKVFPYDVLQGYASMDEFKKMITAEDKSFWTVALLTAGYFYVPLLNFLAPPLIALTFIFFCLGKLAEYRTQRS